MKSSTDVAFSPAVKRVQAERGSRAAYARVEKQGGFATEVDDQLRGFLAEVDTAFLATASADGQPYVQHRGGPKGFIHALDDHTIAFTEYSGNRQYISTGNLSENNRVCLLLMDFAHRRRVKVWGTARLENDQMVISVTAWDVNCPQHITQKLDAEDVGAAVAKLKARIGELEAENRRLRANAAG